jgi:hypothetical protein
MRAIVRGSMFEDAVASYDVRRLDVDWDEDALANLRREAADARIFLLGESHGRYATPQALYTLVHALGFRALALEWEPVLEPVVRRFLGTNSFDVPSHLEASFASGDGTLTAGHFALLRRLHDEGRLERLILFDDTPADFGGPWAERDRRMAEHLLRERDPSLATLAVAGAFHTITEEQSDGAPMGARIVQAVGHVPTGRLEYNTERARFLRGTDGVYVFQLADARPAFVPRLP